MRIYQLDRVLLREQVGRYRQYMRGAVLDVGSGGFNRYQSLFTVIRYVRTDIAPGDDVDVVASADNLPFMDNEFDSLISTQMLEHVQYPEKVVAEMRRVLKPGGYALITVPQWNELHSEPDDFWRYTNYGLHILFERHGFRTVEAEQRGGFFVMRAQMNMRYLIDRFHLYRHPVLGRMASACFRLYGTAAQWFDRIDASTANRKHAIGWCFVFQKI